MGRRDSHHASDVPVELIRAAAQLALGSIGVKRHPVGTGVGLRFAGVSLHQYGPDQIASHIRMLEFFGGLTTNALRIGLNILTGAGGEHNEH